MTTQTHTVQGPTGRLVVTEAGQGGVPVLFVHSLAGHRGQWAAQQAHLKQRSVAFDMRGMGESDTDAQGRYGIPDMTEDVRAVADALGLERFVLVGHSFGGLVAGAFAARWPERLAGLVFVDAGGDGRQTPPELIARVREGYRPENYRAFMDGWFGSILRDAKPRTREAVLDALHATPREVVMGAQTSMLAYDPFPTFERYRGPKLSLVVDAFVQPTALHKLIPELPVRVFSGVSHWLQMDVPDAVNAELDAFLAGVRA
jgi:pimeloyl-ACP methyl ester carboxylesterase